MDTFWDLFINKASNKISNLPVFQVQCQGKLPRNAQ